MMPLLWLCLSIVTVAPAVAADTAPAGAEDLQQQLAEAVEHLREVEASRSRLSADLEAERIFKEQLVQQLQQREADLKEAEAVITVLQQEGPPDAAAADQPAGQESLPEAAPPATERHQVKVFQVDEEHGVLVLSNPAVAGVEEGWPFVLETAEQLPMATIRFVEQDRVGFAVASIVTRPGGQTPIQKGQDCFVRRP